MTKKERVTRRSVLASFLALAVCISMLVGTSYAWFTDSVTSSGNVIKSGKLDIEMYWADGKGPTDDTAQWQDASAGAIFKDDVLWEPGFVQVRHINIKNVGNLAFKYKFAIVANGTLDTNANDHTLADAIDVYYVDPAVQIRTRNLLTDAYKLDTLTNVLANIASANSTAQGVLYPAGKEPAGGKSQETVTIALKMRENAGNEYQNMSLGTDFSVQVLATQYTFEQDTFDDQYDKDADEKPDNIGWPYDKVSTVTVTDPTTPVTLTAGNVAVTVPTNAISAGEKYDLIVDDVNIVTSGVQTTVDLDIMLKKNGALISAQPGVNYTVEISLDSGLVITSVKHNGTELADTEYSYSGNTLTITTASFSPFQIIYTKGNVTQEAIQAVNDAIQTLPSAQQAVVEETLKKTAGDNVAPAVAAITSAIQNDNQEVLDVIIDAVNTANENNTKAQFMQSIADAFDDGKTLVVADTSEEIKSALSSGSSAVAVVIPVSEEGYSIPGSALKNNSNIIGDGDTTVKLTSSVSADNISAENIKFINKGGNALSLSGTGEFTNCTFEGSNGTRWCYARDGGEVKFVDCKIYGSTYGTHFDSGTGHVVYENCDITGWNSFGGQISSVSFTNCTFHKSNYGSIRFYQNGSITNCTFDDDYVFVDAQSDNVTITITNSNIPISKLSSPNQNVKWIIDGVETNVNG